MIDEEIRGEGTYDIHVTHEYVEVDDGLNRRRVLLDEDGWMELQAVVTEVCAYYGWI